MFVKGPEEDLEEDDDNIQNLDDDDDDDSEFDDIFAKLQNDKKPKKQPLPAEDESTKSRKSGESQLLDGCLFNRKEEVKELLINGINPNCHDDLGNTPLHNAGNSAILY